MRLARHDEVDQRGRSACVRVYASLLLFTLFSRVRVYRYRVRYVSVYVCACARGRAWPNLYQNERAMRDDGAR